MTRRLVPLATPDLSAFAKTLKKLLDERHAAELPLPSHVELLNLLARAAGQRNFATLKASAVQAPELPTLAEPSPALEPQPQQAPDLNNLTPTVRKALLQFDETRRLVRLPSKRSVLEMTLWVLWTQFAAKRKYTEKEVNALLNAHHTFGDPATLRRELIGMKLLDRKSDCSAYWKLAPRPTPEIQAFVQAWRAVRPVKRVTHRPATAQP